MGFITQANSKLELTPEMIMGMMPKLIVTHLVEIADEKKHPSVEAVRRLFNFIRLYRIMIELKPETMDKINE